MKKIIPIILMMISILLSGALIYIAIYENDLPELLTSIGFIVIGYIAVILFAIGWFKIKKK